MLTVLWKSAGQYSLKKGSIVNKQAPKAINSSFAFEVQQAGLSNWKLFDIEQHRCIRAIDNLDLKAFNQSFAKTHV